MASKRIAALILNSNRQRRVAHLTPRSLYPFHYPTPRDNHEQKLLEYFPRFLGMYYHVKGAFLHFLDIPSESTPRRRMANGC